MNRSDQITEGGFAEDQDLVAVTEALLTIREQSNAVLRAIDETINTMRMVTAVRSAFPPAIDAEANGSPSNGSSSNGASGDPAPALPKLRNGDRPAARAPSQGESVPSEGAILIAIQMAAAGSPQGEIAVRLRDEFGLPHAADIAARVVGSQNGHR